jgi:signal transduction histidine kinase
MSKRGHGRAASFLLVGFDTAGTIYTGWQWGASLPATLLLTALVIVTTSVLIGSTTGFVVTGGMIGVLTALGIHEATVLNIPSWRYDEITSTDVIAYSALLLFMSFIGWLSNLEIDRSLTRARTSEGLLEAERNALEKKVAERTEELVAAQANIVTGLERSASIGELSRGVFHDLLSPLSAVALSVEEIAKIAKSSGGTGGNGSLDIVEKAVAASKRMGSFMDSVRRHIDNKDIHESSMETVDICKEIGMARDILAYKARTTNVCIAIEQFNPVEIKADPVRIHQVFLNLISNAIDSCADKEGERTVNVSAEKYPAGNDEGAIRITVADTGCGMSPELLRTLFDKPFTTKPKGTGIGLVTVKSIVEKELCGRIEVKSTEGAGTTFIITVPVSSHERPGNGKTPPGNGKYRGSHTSHP